MPGANVGNQVAVFEQGARHIGQDVRSLFLAVPRAIVAKAHGFRPSCDEQICKIRLPCNFEALAQ